MLSYSPKIARSVSAFVLATGLSLYAPSGLSAQELAYTELPNRHEDYPFNAAEIDLKMALNLFAKNLRIGAKVSEDVSGTVKDLPDALNRQQYLDELATAFDLVWYFDGQILHVSPVGDIETRVIPLRDNAGAEVIRVLRSLSLYQPKFQHRSDVRSRTLLVSGPVDYVELVANAAEAVETADRTDITLLRGNEGSIPAALQALEAATADPTEDTRQPATTGQ